MSELQLLVLDGAGCTFVLYTWIKHFYNITNDKLQKRVEIGTRCITSVIKYGESLYTDGIVHINEILI